MTDILQNPWVIIPTYNEKLNIERMIRSLFELSIPNLRVLIVDDSSPDGTGAIVESMKSQLPHLQLLTRTEKSGLGRAYIHGMKHALAEGASAVVQMDADFSHDPSDVPKLFAALKEYDFAMGSRYAGGISVINWPLHRLLLSIGANWYVRLVTGMPYNDSTGGFRSWRATTLQAIDLDTVNADGYGFQIVMTHRAWKKKLSITEVPIIFTERRAGQSKMSKAIMWEAFWLVWKLKFFS